MGDWIELISSVSLLINMKEVEKCLRYMRVDERSLQPPRLVRLIGEFVLYAIDHNSILESTRNMIISCEFSFPNVNGLPLTG